jgi:hypothetical protein
MIAMSLTYPDLPKPETPRDSAAAVSQEGQRLGVAPAATPFQPIESDIVNAAIPAFFIGRNKEGFWLARDVKGQIGGIFLFESSALSFARRNSRPSGCATIFPAERFELDLENRGNPHIVYLRPLIRLAVHGLHAMALLAGKFTEAVERRSKAL